MSSYIDQFCDNLILRMQHILRTNLSESDLQNLRARVF
ncbi:unnamed protein product [Tenebrio molitor]|nr:unnamed protein product [Tenebrio molitor]